MSLQNALENLEVLEDMLKVKSQVKAHFISLIFSIPFFQTSGEYSPEELMSQVLKEAQAHGEAGRDTEDSSSDSDAGSEEEEKESGSPAKLQSVVKKSEGTESVSQMQDGKEPPSKPMLQEAKSEADAAQATHYVSEKGSSPPPSLPEAEDDCKRERVPKCLPTSGQVSLPDPKLESESSEADQVKTIPPISQASFPQPDSGSNSSSEPQSPKGEEAGAADAGNDGVFKPFSKKLKVLGSKTEIKINIRQKGAGTAAQTEEGNDGGDSKEATNAKSGRSKVTAMNLKAKTTREDKREAESKGHKRSSRRSRTQSRSRSKFRSRSRHRHRRSRSHSRSPRHRQSRYRSRSHSRRSRSRSRRSRRRRSRSYSRHRSRSRSRSYSKSPPPVKQKKTGADKKVQQNSTKQTKDTQSKSMKSEKEKSEEKDDQMATTDNKGGKKNEISQLTAFCKDLQEKQAHEDVYGESLQVQAAEVRKLHYFTHSCYTNLQVLVTI